LPAAGNPCFPEKPMNRLARLTLIAAVAAALMPPALALDRGTVLGDRAYTMGGVGEDEVAQMKGERSRYTLQVTTAQRDTGAFLADARVRITNAGSQQVVFDQPLSGPMLLIDLPPGRYDVSVVYQGREQHQSATVGKGTSEVGFRF
jgi:hypothetical protein